MGDPAKHRRKYEKPMHPWQRGRIEKERIILSNYGLKNKKEIWRMDSKRKSFADQAKRLIAAKGKQADTERNLLFTRLIRLGLLFGTPKLDDVLSLTLEDVMNRRLQSLVHKKGFARSMKQARQFITHQHIMVGGKAVTAPSYLVPLTQESSITFLQQSSLGSIDHPERVPIQKKPTRQRPPRPQQRSGPGRSGPGRRGQRR